MTRLLGRKRGRPERDAPKVSSSKLPAPLRAELFNLEQLKTHAQSLARQHEIDPSHRPFSLLDRLAENEQVLSKTYDAICETVKAGRRIAPASEWLLDNFYLIEQQIQVARRHLPRQYSRQLPRLGNGELSGYPRVFALAQELISHVDGQVDMNNVTGFVSAYQTITALKLGELWAVPIMLRLALIENLRRVAVHMTLRRTHRDLAISWADQLLRIAEKKPKMLLVELATFAQSDPPLDSGAFVEEFLSRLQGHGPALTLVLTWVDQQLADQGLNSEQLARAESQWQAADQVSIVHSVAGLRFLGASDWREFVESLSVTEQTLREDPSGAHALQTFATRDHYRHAVEEIAGRCALPEEGVARRAVRLALDAQARSDSGNRQAHVGYYLVDEGRPVLEKAVAARWSLKSVSKRAGRPYPLTFYLLPILIITLSLLSAPLAVAAPLGTGDWRFWLLTITALVSASSLAISLVNLIMTMIMRPRVPPRLEFSNGIPDEHRAMVVIPTLLRNENEVDELIEKLEIHYLGNRDPNLRYALLTDLVDAPEETMPEDKPLVERARRGIQELNTKHAKHQKGQENVFFLFHRPRTWNPHEQLWMGYERKRGKLMQFNAVLRGQSRENFSLVEGDIEPLRDVKYVITLDADTQLPRNAAHELVGTMAHPLNQPVYDPHQSRVVAGHGILQPRIAVNLPSTSRSLFAQLFAGEAGIDPYTREVSDVYQDLFAEGSYVGKGIYHVDAFTKSLHGRFPENLILSHDLLEGAYGRSGLVTDVELFEDQPASYLAEASRRHRWMRGDWQIAGWLLPRVPGPEGKRLPNPISGLSRWKILDNLRRSLTPVALMIMWITAVLTQPARIDFWTLGLVGILILSPAFGSTLELFRKPRERTWRAHVELTLGISARHLAMAILTLVMLPYDALLSLKALMDSGLRLWITSRGLLLWYTNQSARRSARRKWTEFYTEMWIAPTLALALALALTVTGALPKLSASASAFTWPMLGTWFLTPLIGWWISKPLRGAEIVLNRRETWFLRQVARRTWRYFEEFAGPMDNWLAPDNFQMHPSPAVATRSSPTNIGMELLANLAAHDFGYISTSQFLERTEKAMVTMKKLDRFRGHFYNWYDTRTLQPLHPIYVSSVDSGNLAGALLALRAGLDEIRTQPVFSERTLSGLGDTLLALESELDSGHLDPPLGDHLESIRQKLRTVPATIAEARELLHDLSRDAVRLVAQFTEHPKGEAQWWACAFEDQCHATIHDLSWVPSGEGRPVPTLEQLAQSAKSELQQQAREWMQLADAMAKQCCEWIADMDFSFLYDSARNLLAIGYNTEARRCDPSYYDLLASEARLASFLLIAQGKLPQEHWFSLSRLLTSHDGATTLLSWSGSMFEYLMPMLLLPSYENTLLDHTCRAAVARQIHYGRQRGVPWGISESCYNAVDLHQVYQYRAFGVPGLGFKRGLSDDLVIAPYASALALAVAPREACHNLQTLAGEGFLGPYGFFEAIDFTPSRVPRGQKSVAVRTFMAHHQGMTLLSLEHVLLDRPMQRRVMSDPLIKATELLLQERLPKTITTLYPHASEVSEAARPATVERETNLRVYLNPSSALPEVHLLSNGTYHVMATHAGGGYSRWRDLAVTRWREDITCDQWGSFIYLRDLGTGQFWSTAFQPTLRTADRYEAIFTQGRAEYRRRDEDLDTHTEIIVSPEDNVEIRRVKLTNLAHHARTIEVTSYAEIVLAPLNADMAHRAFSNLFVHTELVRGRQAILGTRRRRDPMENPPWVLHLVTLQGNQEGPPSCETDRERFLGRGRTVAHPAALDQNTAGHPLSNHAGAVLDPIVAMRRVAKLEPDESATVHVISGVAETRAEALALVEKFLDPRLADRAFDMAWSHQQMVLHHFGASEADAQMYSRLASPILYAHSLHRAPASVLSRNQQGQSALWRHGVSGDWPIVLFRIANDQRLNLVKQALQAHAYWRANGLPVDLVILNDDFSGYRQALHESILDLVAASTEAPFVDKPGGIFVRRGEQISEEDHVLFQAVARLVLSDTVQTLADQVERRLLPERWPPMLMPTEEASGSITEPPRRELSFFNGWGGFTSDGREYIITLRPGQTTPAPWVNVMANPGIGSVISESGSAYTWVDNAHEFRLTPWSNDPVTDVSGEAFYIRDEDTGQYWSPSPLPARGRGHYVTRHGFGYSVFEHDEEGLYSELWTYVATDAPVKICLLKLRNRSGRPRRFSVTGFWELVLGEWRHTNMTNIVTQMDPNSGALLARNAFSREFGDRVTFITTSERDRTYTGSRTEFLGRNGTMAQPAALGRTHLAGRVGAALDPCGAFQVPIELSENESEEREIVFLLGAAHNVEEVRQLVQRFGRRYGAHQALEAVWRQWNDLLGAVQIETPEPALNFLVNGWLPYQTLASRVWGRSGYYQSGGAFGFRDQLQDTMALTHNAPWLTRQQILRCAGRQFPEGDVQHWWHPPGGRGVRTHCSDDYLWLPYAVCRYVFATNDTGVLDEHLPFLEGRPVNPDEESYYDLPGQFDGTATLYDHCVRAIEHGLSFGLHGLPLMGSGDWNDGMNRVGPQGLGESIWLGWFLCDVLRQFARLAKQYGDDLFAKRCRVQMEALSARIEAESWDGEWYRRAYFDNGMPLGSAQNEECRIDSISQSWAVISGAGEPARARQAMESVNKLLVDRSAQLIRLLSPPFDKAEIEPGYIKGYIPGVRENGGQYTHAAVWTVMAYALLGDRERAWELFRMLNPIHHAEKRKEAALYKTEPYVLAGDIYSAPPHTGRGGWSWYTGSAGWMLRLALENLLGLHREGTQLHIKPCLPDTWKSCRIHYRFWETVYHLIYEFADKKPTRVVKVLLDGQVQEENVIFLVNDRMEHHVEVELG